jgi:hypothetical protein
MSQMSLQFGWKSLWKPPFSFLYTTNDPKTLQFGWKTFLETTVLVSVAQTTINLCLHNNNQCSNVGGDLLKTLAFLGAYNHTKVVLKTGSRKRPTIKLYLWQWLCNLMQNQQILFFYLSFSFGLSHVKYAQHSPVDQTMMRLLIS